MNARKILGAILLLAGTLVLVYRGFNYTSKKHTARLGSLDFSIKEKEHVEIPVWAGVVAIAAGAALLLLPLKRR
jgi:drug/metabolite transporter (DMT)-like permease